MADPVWLELRGKCHHCFGTGVRSGDFPDSQCPYCEGEGRDLSMNSVYEVDLGEIIHKLNMIEADINYIKAKV